MLDVIGAGYQRFVARLDQDNAERLARLATILQYSFLTGFILGGWSGSRHASLVFAAEHQHVLPGIRTRREASAYFRNRNARVMLGAAREGLKRGMQLARVGAVFGLTKWIVSAWRETPVGLPRRLGGEGEEVVEWENLAAGTMAGSLFAWAAKGQRWYQLRRGLLMGGAFGLLLTSLGYLQQRYTHKQCDRGV